MSEEIEKESVGDTVRRLVEEAAAEPEVSDDETTEEVTEESDDAVESEEQETEANASEADEEADQEESEELTEEAEDEQAELEAIDAPVSWKKEDREWFYQLADKIGDVEAAKAIQQTIARRENERDEYVNRLRKKTEAEEASINQFNQAIEPYRQALGLQGLSEAQIAQNVLETYAAFQNSPQEAINYLANQYGVGVSFTGQESTEQYNPEIATLRQQVAGLSTSLEQQQYAKLQALNEENARVIDQFRNAADKNGNLLHPFMDEVETEIAMFSRQMRDANPTMPSAEILEKSYERAVYANPETRARISEKEEQRKKINDLAKRRAAGKKAKTAAQSIAPKPAIKAEESPLSVRDIVTKQFAKQGLL